MELLPFVLIPLLAIGGILLFVAFWSSIVLLVGALSGWRKLATDFEALREPMGNTFRWQSLKIGMSSSYSGSINITPGIDGLHMRPLLIFRAGHKPLLIPWEYITFGKEQGGGRFTWATLEIAPKYGGASKQLTFFNAQLIEEIRQFIKPSAW